MYDDMKLSSAQRGYKQAGKKLRPRDGFDAMERDHMKLRSLRALRRHRAVEFAHNIAALGNPDEEQPHVVRFERAMAALPQRWRKKVYDALEHDTPPALPPRAQRAYDRAIECDQIERCMQHDEMMLRNCY